MPSCVVKGCKNYSNTQKKSHGITYHLFPSNDEIKIKWIEAIRNSRHDPQWLPSKASTVCSNHFDNIDLYTTNGGLRRVIKSGYPKKGLPDSSDVTVSVQDLPDLPNAATECMVLPSTSSTLISDSPDSPNAAIDCIVLPSTSSTLISDSPDSPNAAIDCIVLPNASSALTPVLPVSPTMSKLTDEAEINFDTPREHKLRQTLNLKNIILRKSQKKIKILQQRVRRLKNRNKSLEDIICTLKKDNYISR